MIRLPPRSTLSSSSAASDVYKRQQQQPMIQNTSSYKPQPYAIQHSIYSDQRAQSMHPQFQQAFSTQFQQQQQQSQAPLNPPIIIKTTESPKQQVAKVSLVQSKRSSHRFSKRKQRKNSESDQSVDGNNENFCGVHFQSSQIQKEQFENSQNKQAEGNYGLCQIF
eukprot:TRINITY_DN2470_c0_g1_i1.p2 TRINITY_DN2470_c0_g1~~TRINITY_DN2470_c0_g1_i1.p2  ORF type:complete len:165 (-),score=22.54 TRINITY_DN2470_c0_g1_i1:214-708(-)